MSLVVPNVSELELLEAIRANELDGGDLRLFTGSHVPAASDTLSTYTAIEPSFGGYAAITCSSWGAVFTNGDGEAETDETVRTFTATGSGLPVTVTGVFYVNPSGDLLYAERFQSSVTVTNAGDTVSYLPVFTGRSQN